MSNNTTNKVYHIEKYSMQINDKADGTCSITLKPVNADANNLALKKERRKIYIITSINEVLYIGEANTSMKNRFQRGCTSYNYFIKNKKARGGYKGYKWLDRKMNHDRNLLVIVVIFEPEYDADKEKDIIEAIEGELVFSIRKRLGMWPKFQNEIHFHNIIDAKKIAESIFRKL